MEFVSELSSNGTRRVTVEGDLTIYHAAEIKQRLIEDIRAEPVLELDLSHVGEIDTAGVQILALLKRESQRLDHPLHIVGHGAAVREIIEFFNLVGFLGDPLVIPAHEHA